MENMSPKASRLKSTLDIVHSAVYCPPVDANPTAPKQICRASPVFPSCCREPGKRPNTERWAKRRVLIACEFSGIVRDAFAALGHEAWSCDLLPSEANGQHIQGDILNIRTGGFALLEWHWDLMI